MAEQQWSAKVRPELHPAAAELVAIYEAVPGALTYPGCCPEALAAVLTTMGIRIAEELEPAPALWGYAALLRGEQP